MAVQIENFASLESAMKTNRLLSILLSASLICTSPSSAASSPSPESSPEKSRPIVGWVEQVRLFPRDIALHAKLGIGSEKSSLHAEGLEEFKRKGKRWVRFGLIDRAAQRFILERPVLERVTVKQPGGHSQRRYVVLLGICLANKYVEMKVTLTDRSEFEHELSIGREVLAGLVIVDPARSFTSSPQCSNIPEIR